MHGLLGSLLTATPVGFEVVNTMLLRRGTVRRYGGAGLWARYMFYDTEVSQVRLCQRDTLYGLKRSAAASKGRGDGTKRVSKVRKGPKRRASKSCTPPSLSATTAYRGSGSFRGSKN